jgi:3'-5' exoribonuclease
MKTVYVTDITPGGAISGETFAIAEAKQASDKNGNPYFDLVLTDKSGSISAKIWSEALPRIDRSLLKPGKVVAVSATVSEYKGNVQLTITEISQVDETKMEEYLESSQFPVEDMYKELQDIIQTKIEDTAIKALLENTFADADVARRFKYWPAATSFHHNFRSGLLQHVLECLSLVDGLQRFYPELDFDIVRAGLIYHDIGKLEEIDGEGLVANYTAKGSILGHMHLGIQILERFAPENLPEYVKDHLKHIILSHHGEKEKGSPVLPATPEALLVAGVDDTSAKTNMGIKAMAEPANEQGMSGYNRWLGRFMWVDRRTTPSAE